MRSGRTGVFTRFQFSRHGINAALLTALFCATTPAVSSAQEPKFRPPSVPLVAVNPNFSVWSPADRLADETTLHWTGKPHPLTSLIRVDGKSLRLMGAEPKDMPAMPQTSLEVLPTRTFYQFANDQLEVRLSFLTPALPENLDVLARPLTYLAWDVRARDGKSHQVEIFDSASALLAVNTPDQVVDWETSQAGDLLVTRTGTADQTLLEPAGDDTRVDWGHLYLAAPRASAQAAIGSRSALVESFVKTGKLPAVAEDRQARAANNDEPTLAVAFDLGKVGDQFASRHALLAYDEIYAIKFLGRKLRPFWRKDGATPHDLLQAAERDYEKLNTQSASFDKELMADLTTVGGEKYAQMCALAYRQALAGHGLAADAHGEPLLFAKENSSNGCIATVDVIYPAAPQFLLMGPTYAKALVAADMVYSASPQWKFPFAPHDIGVYPQANGQVYGGGESPGQEDLKMPVEESGNLILLCAAIAHMEGNADFASRWWPQLTAWEKYLEKFGLDPENQLCTDDFMGHLAHNSNLSIKAILSIAAYGDLCRMRGDEDSARKYLDLARADAQHWMEAAADGDHSRIAFDQKNTWSQKYNLVWDRVLGWNVFPPEVAQQELDHYRRVALRYGVPLDSRTHLTKTDWLFWCASLTGKKSDLEQLVSPAYDYLNQTSARLPFVDSYTTDNLKEEGLLFRARPVIGGVFMPMLGDAAMWKKWAARDKRPAGKWADAPSPPRVTDIVPTSERQAARWHYTFDAPAADWTRPQFDDHAWKEGPGGFGAPGTPGALVGTPWTSSDIWLRREISLPSDKPLANPQALVYHDEDVEIYFNGELAARAGGFTSGYAPLDLRPAAAGLLKPGAKLLIAVHCHQTLGGQGVDVGIIDVEEEK